MKKASIVLLLALMLTLSLSAAAAAEIVDSGSCGAEGDNLTWELNSDGLLTISGYGAMADYGYNDDYSEYLSPPWDSRQTRVLVISSGVTSVGNYAFASCTRLTEATIPASVASIGDEAFSSCTRLAAVYYDGTPDNWVLIRNTERNNTLFTVNVYFTGMPEPVEQGYCGDNLIWALDADGVLTISGYGDMMGYDTGIISPWRNRSDITELIIGDGVTGIGNAAFSGCTGLTEVTIPDNVTEIGEYAFISCTGLTELTLGCSLINIGQYAFSGCSGLTRLIIPDSVTYIDPYAFSQCTNLISVELGSGVTFIGDNAFRYCIGLTNIAIQTGLEQINNSAFYGCSSLQDVYYSGTAEQWDDTIYIEYENDNLLNATFHYEHTVTAPQITKQPVDYTGAPGFTIKFTVAAQGEELSYQWYFKRAGESSFQKSTVSAAKKATFTMTMADKYDGWQYYCLIKDSFGHRVRTDTVTIHKKPAIVISKQPDDFFGAPGRTIKFTVSASGSGLTYQWYYRRGDSGSFSKSTLSSGKKATYTMTMAAKYNGWQYYCLITDSKGNTMTTATVTVHQVPAPVITVQPQDFTGAAGNKITFRVEATGDGLTYQWWYKSAAASSFSKSTLASGKKATYTMTMADRHEGWQYYCVVTDAYGQTVRSNTVTVHKVPAPSITNQPTDYSGAAGSTIKFTVKADGEGLTYQWYFKRAGESAYNKSTVAAAKKATFTMKMAAKYDGWQYYCLITDQYGQTVKSDTVTIHLN